MTSAQMLKRTTRISIWEPLMRPHTVEMPPGGVSRVDLLFMEQSEALLAGKCPLCHAGVDSALERDGMVRFNCQRSPVFHEWRRTQAFLTKD